MNRYEKHRASPAWKQHYEKGERKASIQSIYDDYNHMYILITFNDINKYNYVAKDLRSYIYLVRKTLYPDARSGL